MLSRILVPYALLIFLLVCMCNTCLQVVREKDDMETWWQRKTAMVLLKNGDRRLLVALSDAIENGIPCLARASLVTVSWISSVLQSMEEQNLQSVACSVLLPQLLQALDFDKTIEERTLASFSLLNLLKGSGIRHF